MNLVEFIQRSKDCNPEDCPAVIFPLINENIIGRNQTFEGPFGVRKIIYADYFASGKSLEMIENHIRQVVLPFYANTHTEASETGCRTSQFREEARSIIRKCVNGTSTNSISESKIIFTGSGSTAAINKLVHMFRLKEKHVWEK
jgi:selenocysteine lyase/cysteine desulfurase